MIIIQFSVQVHRSKFIGPIVTLSHADVGGGELEEEDLGGGTELVREGRDRQRLRSDEQKLDGNF